MKRSSCDRVMLVVNSDWFFISHWLDYALLLKKKGFEVHIVTEITNDKEQIESHGLIVHSLTIKKGSNGMWTNIKTFINIFSLIKLVRPILVELYTIKPVLFGGISTRLLKTPATVFYITGMGSVFLSRGRLAKLREYVVGLLYTVSLSGKNSKVICENADDRDLLIKKTSLPLEKFTILPGAGIDLNKYSFTQIDNSIPQISLISRLLRDKGVVEYVEAVQLLNDRNCKIKFNLIGDIDPPNPSSITQNELNSWYKIKNLQIKGYMTNIEDIMKLSSIIVLPSYREGFPKVLIEAASCGRAVITTDVPGCRDAIINNTTGILIPPKDARALADAIECLILDKNTVKKMGEAGRILAESKYNIEHIVKLHLNVYKKLLSNLS